jgi:hypothetical protein
MYWQVYLHKTAVAYEKMLVNMLRRAKFLVSQGRSVFASPALSYFLENEVDASWFATHEEALLMYEELDDSDIWSAMKAWRHCDDKILSRLAGGMLDRRIFRVEVNDNPVSEDEISTLAARIAEHEKVTEDEARQYLMSVNTIQKDMYSMDDDHIGILYKDGTVKDVSEASELLNVSLLSKKIRKYYLCYQRI